MINSSSVVLDVGCGRGAHAEDPISIRKELRILKGKCKRVIGIDVDKVGEENPFLDEFRLITSSCWRLDNDTVDVCVCDTLLEHVEAPEIFFSECQRVIKQGGYLCIRTPNVLSYIGLFSKIIPNRFHVAVVNKVQDKRRAEDVFPTYYRCNTKRKMRNMLNKYGFDHCVYGYEAEPSYLSFSRLFYLLGVIHQRFAPNVLKCAIFAFGRKK
jgi:SAM-dependent methyltransferase